MERHRKQNNTAIWVWLAIALLVAGASISKTSQKSRATVQDGHITRSCEQLLKFLDQDPADITAQPYTEHIPKQIQQDIDAMLNSEEDLDIVYTAQGREVIRIEKNVEGYSEIIVTVKKMAQDYYAGLEDSFISNLSFYRNGDSIVIYGSEGINRCLGRVAVEADTGFYDGRNFFWGEYIDLFGIELDYQEIRPYGGDMTFLQVGNQFMFYRNGQQVGEGESLSEGTIEEVNFYYILNNWNDLYYLYYCPNTEAPWIRLVKVDNNVQIAEDCFVRGEENLKYQIYWKDGKRYAGISNPKLEKTYGQNFGRSRDAISQEELDFNIEVVELSKENISKIVIQKRDVSTYSTERYDWYLCYCYEANSQTIYETQRIDGLDSYLYGRIPGGVLEKYEGMEITIEQVEQVIEELKQIYLKYEEKFYEEEPPLGAPLASILQK